MVALPPHEGRVAAVEVEPAAVLPSPRPVLAHQRRPPRRQARQVRLEAARLQVAVEEVDGLARPDAALPVVADLEPLDGLRAAHGHVGLPIEPAAVEVDHDQLERLPLPLVDGQGPRERKRQLRANDRAAPATAGFVRARLSE
eukprot:2861561-Prymnesium_polylepis.1